MDKILLIDGMNSIYRASIGFGPNKKKHELCSDLYIDEACPHLINLGKVHCTCGQLWVNDKCNSDVNEEYIVVFNFFRNLRPIIEQFSPDKCFFVLEGHPKFRYDLYSDYKANRIIKTAEKQIAKDKFHLAKDEIIRLIKYLPITVAKALDYECDDVIATLVDNLKEESMTVLSGDSDYIQLLQKNYKSLSIYDPIKKKFMEAPSFPYVAWKCLVGDKSDNIKGINGIGDKRAQTLLSDPDKLKKCMELEENRATVSINKQLIEFRMVPENEILIEDGSTSFDVLKEEFRKMQFNSIINDNSWVKYTNTFKCLKY